MMKKQQGFTLIELVAVIVILGALAVVALPRFVNLQDEANEAALDGVAGAAGSATAVNLAAALANSNESTDFTDCTQIGDLMQGGLPSGYTPTEVSTSTEWDSGDTGGAATCQLEQTETNNTAEFTGYYVSG